MLTQDSSQYKPDTEKGRILLEGWSVSVALGTSHDERIHQFYDGLLGTAWNREHTIDLQALGIPTYDLVDLEVTFIEKEVWETIKQLPSDKAPIPNGFTWLFYKLLCWSVIKEDIMTVMFAIWSRNFCNFNTLNNAYITLIPKVEDAEQVKDFRPISLVHNFAKLVTKLLANRLATKLQDMVSPVQSVFYLR
jgi:hypothetical protein